MAYLNQQEREDLLNRLTKMKFNKAKHTLVRMDPKGKLTMFRNSQQPGSYVTKVRLNGLGTIVTLIEKGDFKEQGALEKSNYILDEIIVEPTPDNRT